MYFLTLFSFNRIITKAVDNNYSYDSYDEQLHFLYDNNISIPDGFSDDSNFSIFLNNIFECLRNDINFNFCFNYSETIEFVDEIRNALKKNASDYSLMSEDKRVISNLTNSLVMKDGKWVTSGGDYKDAFQNYNCYSFAIDRLDFNSGFLTANHNISNYKLQIGALSGEKWYSSFGVEKTAKIVVEDLKILGFQNVEYHTSLPNNIDGKDLICLRIGTMDFHFMKYDKISKCWFHKIGESAIMKYIGSFDNNNSWLSEYSYKGVEYDLPVLYTSDIYYITYDSNNVDINCSAKFDSIESLSLTNNKIKDYVYDLNVNSEMNYRFIFGSQNKFYLYLYDCIGNIISEYDSTMNDNNYVLNIEKYFNVGKYYIETVFLNEMTSTNRGPEFEIILDAGNYYFGFIDNVNNVSITYAIERKINENVDINNTLIADPYESGCDVGSEVMFNNGAIREYTITEGFTRNLYLLFDGVPTQYSSRLDYDWYSSNDSVATVTTYGTVLGLNVEEDTEVTIYAIRKSDPSIIYKRTFTILNDLDEEIIEIECDMSYSYSLKNGVYQLQLNSDNSPYPMIQYYSFEVHEWVQEGEFEVTLDYWGRVTATGPGACVIIGTYILNPRVRVIINLLIEE